VKLDPSGRPVRGLEILNIEALKM